MLLFCTTNFPVCVTSFVAQTSQFVTPERCVFRKCSSNTTGYSQNCLSPILFIFSESQQKSVLNPCGIRVLWADEMR